jgi:folate-binding protein YgfZ
MRQQQRTRENRSHGIGGILSGQWRRRSVHRLEHRRPAGIDIAAGRHAKTALKPCREVGNDVAKDVIGNNYVKLARVADHLHAERVHVHVLGFDLGIFGGHVLEHALPQATCVSHGIGFVAHEHTGAAAAIRFLAGRCVLECEANDALHALTRIDVFLNRNFVGSSLLEYSARIGIDAFSVFADHNEVHVLRLNALQGAERIIEQAHRTEVCIQVHLESHAEENLFGVNIRRNPGISERTHHDGIKVAGQHGKTIVRDGGAIFEIAVGTPIEMREGNRSAGRFNDSDRLGNHFLANAIAGQDGDSLLFFAHGTEGNTSAREAAWVLQRELSGGLNPHSLGYNRRSMELVAPVNESPEVSDSRRELTALVAGCGIYRPNRVLFSITGKDRTRWLNGMVTNNIRDLKPGRGVYSFVLNSQGHILGDLYVFNRGESLIAEIENSQADGLLQILKRYIIMDKVEIELLSGQIAVLGIAGPKAAEALRSAGLGRDLEQLEFADLVVNGSRLTLVRQDNPSYATYEVWAPVEQVEAVWNVLVSAGAEEAHEQSLEMFRILCGIPKVGQDIRERALPHETGQERALNYTKGCYIGQEIVERIRARGNVHKTFVGFEVDGPVPAAGTKVQSAGKDVGELTSIASAPLKQKQLALGFIRREALAAGEPLSAGDATVKPVSLPFSEAFH